jgi:serine/threonine protein kinase
MERVDWAEIERFVELGSMLNGKYRIERVLGVGGMGAVVAARHERLGESVAIKFLLPRALGQGRQAQRFLREARAASRIRSPHVARVFDVDLRADGAPFIVMEHLAGETLAARLRREGPLPIHHTVDHLLEACEAIAEAHSLGIIHRDLKPANLFLARGAGNIELLKVLDFGISKLVAPDSSDADSTTGEGFVGSPPYMSPEQLTDPTRIDHRTDIWSLGVILYECLTGKAPFKAESVGQVLAAILQGRPPAVGVLRPGVPAELATTIERCLSRERDARPPDVASLARELVVHGTERGRRALDVVEAVATSSRDSTPPVDTSLPAPATTRPGLDTGTLSAAAEPAPPSTAAPRRDARSRAAILVTALAGIAVAVAFVNTRVTAESPLPSAAASDGATAPAVPSVLPVATPAQTAEAPLAAASAMPPKPSARPKARPLPATSAAPRSSAAPRGFDPVFDERR